MSLPQNLQAYLEHHKIGALFEELMGKVISDMPDDPIYYLVRSLEKKSTRQTSRRSLDRGDKDSQDAERRYGKPWLSSSKPLRPKPAEKAPSSASTSKKVKGDWVSQSLKPGSTFDELWSASEDPTEIHKMKKKSLSKSTPTGAFSGGDQEFLFTSNGYEGPRSKRRQVGLEEEFALAVHDEENITPSKYNQHPHKNAALSESKKSKQIMARDLAMLHKKNAMPYISADAEYKNIHEEQGIELMEDLADLKKEGVRVKHGNFTSVARKSRNIAQETVKPKVVVSICARCAHAISNENEMVHQQPHAANSSRPESRQSSVRFDPAIGQGSDDEFESVSQVTGPRHPVWQEDSDSENVTPRKGQHMFASVPDKAGHALKEMNGKSLKQSHKPSATKRDSGVTEASPVLHHQDSDDIDPLLKSNTGSPWVLPATDVGTEASSVYGNDKFDTSGPY